MESLTSADMSPVKILRYYEDGYLSPLTAVPVGRMDDMRRRIDAEVFGTPGPRVDSEHACRYLDHPFLLELCRSPALVAVGRRLLGDDVMLWSGSFWNKPPGGAAVPWHQDIEYWSINPPLNVTVWLAIDPATRANGCLQVIPGSHGQRFEHRRVAGQMLDQEAQVSHADLPEPVHLELEAGQFAVFNERLLHHSAPNTSPHRRLGLVLRLTTPFVRVDSDRPPLFPGHRCVMVCGEDRFGLNRMQMS
jgi:ectoine hydroxylase-related dioxygenase (phytanoyl-CoA dioxygenase family)